METEPLKPGDPGYFQHGFKPPEVDHESIKPIPNENAWGLADHEMPAKPNDAEQKVIDEAIGDMTNATPTEHIPDVSKGSEVEYG